MSSSPEKFKRWMEKKFQNDEQAFDGVIPSSSSRIKKLKFLTYPWHLWILGLFFFICSMVMLGRLDFSKWWLSLVVVATAFFGAMCWFISRIETTKLDLDADIITVSNRSPWQHAFKSGKPPIIHSLSDILSVTAHSTGEFNGDLDTRMHTVRFDFRDGTNISVMESRSLRLTKSRVKKVNHLLQGRRSSPKKLKQPTAFSNSASSSSVHSPKSHLKHSSVSQDELTVVSIVDADNAEKL